MSDYVGKLTAAVFLIIIGGIIFGSTVPIFEETELEIEGNWTEYGALTSNMSTDGDILYPVPNAEGNWTSIVEDKLSAQVIYSEISSDMRDGGGQLRIMAYENSTVSQDSPSRTYVRNLTGNTERFDFTENVSRFDYFQVQIFMEETQGSNNQRPYVDSLRVGFSSIDSRFLDPRNPVTEIIGLLVMFLGVVLLLVSVGG